MCSFDNVSALNFSAAICDDVFYGEFPHILHGEYIYSRKLACSLSVAKKNCAKNLWKLYLLVFLFNLYRNLFLAKEEALYHPPLVIDQTKCHPKFVRVYRRAAKCLGLEMCVLFLRLYEDLYFLCCLYKDGRNAWQRHHTTWLIKKLIACKVQLC